MCEPDELAKITAELAGLIADKPASTVKIGKEAFYQQGEMGLAEAYDYAAKVMVENMLTATLKKESVRLLKNARPTGQAETRLP